jgi:hypothetical protein
MKEYDFYENAVMRMLDRHRFSPPWSVEEAPFVLWCETTTAKHLLTSIAATIRQPSC